MAHPFAKKSEMSAGKDKAKSMTKGYKTGGSIGKSAPSNVAKYAKGGRSKDANAKVPGWKSGGRLDHFARGGRSKGKGKSGNKTNINIVVAPHGKHPPMGAAPPAPGDLPPPGAGPMPPPPGGPMGGPPGLGGPPGMPPGGPPPGLPPGMPGKPPGMMARGGGIKMKAGAETGPGRLEKSKKYNARG